MDYDAGQRMYTIEVTAADPFGMSGTGTVTIDGRPNVNEEAGSSVAARSAEGRISTKTARRNSRGDVRRRPTRMTTR